MNNEDCYYLIVDDLSKEIFKEEKKEVIKTVRKFPKWLRVFLFILVYIVGLATRPLFDHFLINVQNNNVKQNGKTNVNIGQVAGTNTMINIGSDDKCPVKFCSKFKDGNWQYFDRFSVIQDDPLILQSPNSKKLPGATMYFSEEVGNFTMQTFITPLATLSANISVAYGHLLRCIIGDGDYIKTACQLNTDYPTSVENWSYFDSQGNLHGRNQQYQKSSFSVNNELQIRFEMSKIDGRTKIDVKLNDQVPMSWLLPKKFENRAQMEKVGIGLFTAGQDDVKAVFKHFQLDPHI